MKTTTVAIPATIEEATEALSGLGALLTAKEWERAAIVYAFTESDSGRRTDLDGKPARLTLTDFAALKIGGLANRETVSKYRQAWAEHGDTSIKPGDTIILPKIDWPPMSTQAQEEFVRIPKTASGSRVVQKLTPAQKEDVVREIGKASPEVVGKVAAETPAGLQATFKASMDNAPKMSPNTRARSKRNQQARNLSFLDTAFAISSVQEIVDNFAAWYATDPDTADIFLQLMEEAVAAMRLAKEGSVSDEDIAAFMETITE